MAGAYNEFGPGNLAHPLGHQVGHLVNVAVRADVGVEVEYLLAGGERGVDVARPGVQDVVLAQYVEALVRRIAVVAALEIFLVVAELVEIARVVGRVQAVKLFHGEQGVVAGDRGAH